MQLTTEDERAALIKRLGRCRMLAEKLKPMPSSHAPGSRALCIFRDIFSAGPEMMTPATCPANRLNYLRMLQEVSGPTSTCRDLRS